MGPKQKKRYRRKSGALPVLISLAVIVGVAYGAALIWQNTQDSLLEAEAVSGNSISQQEKEQEQEETPVAAEPDNVEPRAAVVEPSSEASSSEGESSDSAAESPLEAARREQFPYALQKTELVPVSYFDDAIFFGDSISTGIPLYNMAPNADVIAFTGISTVNALSNECIDTDEGLQTMLDAAKAKGEKKKVYIMLGGNGLGYDRETFIRGYEEFVDAVKEQYLGALIYVQSMTPVTDYAYLTYPSVSNELIEEYNLAIHDMAKAKGVLYLDVAGALMDENSKLPDDASPVDGMHFSPEYYAKWFAYLRNHAAAEPK